MALKLAMTEYVKLCPTTANPRGI